MKLHQRQRTSRTKKSPFAYLRGKPLQVATPTHTYVPEGSPSRQLLDRVAREQDTREMMHKIMPGPWHYSPMYQLVFTAPEAAALDLIQSLEKQLKGKP